MNKSIKAALAVLSFFALGTAYAAEPTGYYNSCDNTGGKNLLEALHNTISNHTDIGYNALWDLYKESDVYPDGKIWDMYSTKHWNASEKCGNYTNIGDCYNREHSMPKSWFSDAAPMVSDAFHIYPTDGRVNGQRGNYPFGECANGQYIAPKGGVEARGKLGASTYPGYSGTVFEPDDEYKGDFARSYFYMVACYYDRIAKWDSEMLAGNSYPALDAWAKDMLMRWHRLDPVSPKEKDRNEVVYAHQKNRNPFIDHPEMAEYIWGDRTTEQWSYAGSVPTEINQPVNGSTVVMGVSRPGVAIEKSITVYTTAAKDNVSVSVAGAQFSVSPASLSAAQANDGATVTVKYLPAAAGSHTATLTVQAGTVKSVVTLKAEAVDGLPVAAAEKVTDESFDAVWTYVGDADAKGNYTLYVVDDAGTLPGYPKAVNAAAGRYTVGDLMPNADYRYSLASQSMTSEWVDVRTAMPLPSIDFLFDGELYFVAEPGSPSEVAEIFISTANIETDYTVSVQAPFELSLDRSAWSTEISVSPDESRMYMRLYSDEAGTFTTSLKAVYGTYVNDLAVVSGKVVESVSFLEDFEATGQYGTYSAQTYYGTACVWNLNDAGIWSGDPVHDGKQALRCGKNGNALIEMAEGRDNGIGDIVFYAARWNNDAEAKLTVEYSSDGGKTYTTAGTISLSAGTFERFAVHAGAPSGSRMRIRQTGGKRFLIDDIAISDNNTGLADANAVRHQWDTYSRGGSLYVEINAPEGLPVAVYCIDGTTLYSGRLGEGVHSFDALVPGTIYIVASGDFSRTVLVR